MEALLTSSSSFFEFGGNKSYCSIGLERGKMEVELALAKTEMTKLRDENTKLKKMLEQMERDYQSLHMCFSDIMQPQQSNKTIDHHEDHTTNEQELVSLSLGRNHSGLKEDDQIAYARDSNILLSLNNEGLNLASDKYHENISEIEVGKEEEEEEAGEIPSKVLKTKRTSGNDEEASLQQPATKRARVSVRARCDFATMNDGCQWRIYGQKIAKGNPCPRAYYRCTVAPGCPVKKQVQRCMADMSILTTTYEGTHNHPLSASAATMASTTSAAASMLLSGSSTSAMSHPVFERLNFSTNNNNLSPTPFYLPNTSPQDFSTITLDLTSSIISSFQTNTLPSVWENGHLNFSTMSCTKPSLNSQFLPSSYSEKSNQASSQQILTETLTKAITSDPSLKSMINAAISSMVSNGGENKNSIQQAKMQFSL